MGANGVETQQVRSEEERKSSEALLKAADNALNAIQAELARLQRATKLYRQRRGLRDDN